MNYDYNCIKASFLYKKDEKYIKMIVYFCFFNKYVLGTYDMPTII